MAEYPAKLDENRPYEGTWLRNSEHSEQEDTSMRFQRERARKSDREKRILTSSLAIVMSSKWKLEWRNAFSIPKQNYF